VGLYWRCSHPPNVRPGDGTGSAELSLAQGIMQALEFLEADKRGAFVENIMVTGELAGTAGALGCG
jgi:hypothetical protein